MEGSVKQAAGQEFGAEGLNNLASRGDMLQLAQVTFINYEEMVVTLRILGLTGDGSTVTTPLTLPGFGGRGALGRMPEQGDICVCAPMAQTSGGEPVYVIVGWVVQSPSEGYDWLPLWGYDPIEEILPTSKVRSQAASENQYIRRKLRHLTPGSIVASSSQGSDLILDDEVLITNRRANEIRLRDADQAIVFRSLQQFHAMSGVRVYSGLVQRDAASMPLELITDLIEWDSPLQNWVNSEPVIARVIPEAGADTTQVELIADGDVFYVDQARNYYPEGKNPFSKSFFDPGALLPHPVFQRLASDDSKLVSGLLLGDEGIQQDIDPFKIYYDAGFTVSSGYISTEVLDTSNSNSSLVYGGKTYNRIAKDTSQALPVSPINPGLVEHRIEVSHVSDGLLPVTEQTELFDVDRHDKGSSNINRPFVEVVYGSVVGNDPFSEIQNYGKPYNFDKLSVARDTDSVGSQAATLLRVRPERVFGLEGAVPQDAYFSVSKDGRASFRFTGPGGAAGPSARGILDNGLSLSSGSSFNVTSSGPVTLQGGRGGEKNYGITLSAPSSGIRLVSTGLSSEFAPGYLSANRGKSQPSILLDAGKGALYLRSQESVEFETPRINLGNGQTLNLSASSLVSVGSGGTISLSGSSVDISVVGSANWEFVGPKNGIPTNGPTRKTTFSSSPASGHVSGPVDSTEILFGDQVTDINIGSSITRVVKGDIATQVAVGKVDESAGINTNTLDSISGIKTVINSGDIDTTVSTGRMSLRSAQDALVTSLSGTVSIQGANGVYLGGPFPLPANILHDLDVDPITGAPFKSYGMGSSSFRVGPFIPG